MTNSGYSRRAIKREKKTIFIIGEGEHEYTFFLHLKSIYHTRQSLFNIDCAKAKGGSPLGVAQKATRLTAEKSYTKKYVVIDTDVLIPQEYYDYCKLNKLETLKAVKCFSCVLAQIPELKFNHASVGCTSHNGCKAVVFKHLKEKEPTNCKILLQYFPQIKIEEQKTKILLLSQLVNLFSTGRK